MAHADDITVRVFSLNCWLVTDCDLHRNLIHIHVFFEHVFFKKSINTVCIRILRGIHYLSKNLPQRYAMIGDLLCKGEHDIILLQEVGGSCPKVL